MELCGPDCGLGTTWSTHTLTMVKRGQSVKKCTAGTSNLRCKSCDSSDKIMHKPQLICESDFQLLRFMGNHTSNHNHNHNHSLNHPLNHMEVVDSPAWLRKLSPLWMDSLRPSMKAPPAAHGTWPPVAYCGTTWSMALAPWAAPRSWN